MRKVQKLYPNRILVLGLVYDIALLAEEIASDESLVNYDGKQMQRKEWYAYGYQLHQQYKDHQESEALASLLKIAANLGADYFVPLFIQLDDFPNAKLSEDIEEHYSIEFSPNREIALPREKATILLEAMNRFYRKVDFDAFSSCSHLYYNHAIAQINSNHTNLK